MKKDNNRRKYFLAVILLLAGFCVAGLLPLSCAIVHANYPKGIENFNNNLKIVRNYAEIEHRILALQGAGYRVRKTGSVNYKKTYNFYRIDFHPERKRRLLVTAGTHGNEIAGPHAILSYLESVDPAAAFKECGITVIPCVNPWGYEHNSRYAYNGIDINRDFSGNNTSTQEADIIIQTLGNECFDAVLDLHESHAGGAYFYSYNDKTLRILRSFIQKMQKVYAFENQAKVAGYRIQNGILETNGFIISLLRLADRASLPHRYMNPECIITTVETPVGATFGKRVSFHREVIRFVISSLR